MNNFFARQENARRNTGRLLFLFALAVIAVVLGVYLVVALSFWFSDFTRGRAASLWHAQAFFWSSAVSLSFIAAISVWKMMELREGGAAIAKALGARLVPPHTNEPRERLLRNVMEEMAIASGIPVPDLYLMERERGINAFAAGFGTSDAVICVTRGALELLNRDELQGVMAHEFSHILNADILLNLRLLGWLGGIQAVGQTGKAMLEGMRHAGRRAHGGALFAGLALYTVGYLGHFLAQLIKSAVSRQREYLADASAVQFTRNPGGLAGALKKIGGLATGSRLQHPRAGEMSHMFFGNGISDAWLASLDSHPPLPERIKLLDPRFDGVFPKVTPLPAPVDEAAPPRQRPPQVKPAQEYSGAAINALLNSIGEPMQQHLDLAGQLLSELPVPLLAATHDPVTARAVIYGLMLNSDEETRKRQLEAVATLEADHLAREVRKIAPELQLLPPQARLPLLDLSLPALRRLNAEEFARLKKTSDALAAADRRLSVFELALRHLMLRHLQPHFFPSPLRSVQIYGVRGVQKECSCILSTMARVGNKEESAAAEAFAKGVCLLNEPKAEFAFLPGAECSSKALTAALSALDGASPLIKRKLLGACLQCMVHDQVVNVDEVELFRAVADAIGCPVPPWLSSPLPPAGTALQAPSAPGAEHRAQSAADEP
uniref:Peptidase M48 Ste24p n=1 Tax=Geobacter sp. (strain M21) TaxID=443144 RepID=C6E6F2_GEOSM